VLWITWLAEDKSDCLWSLVESFVDAPTARCLDEHQRRSFDTRRKHWICCGASGVGRTNHVHIHNGGGSWRLWGDHGVHIGH
jgi:hypothetical protein